MRDIAGIITNRWGHAYVVPQPGFYFGLNGKPAPWDAVRKGYGRVRFGHSGLTGFQLWDTACDEGERAARQVMEFVRGPARPLRTGISNIYRTLKVGSGNDAHLNEYFCVPQARYLGITPQDIVDYKLPTHPLKEVDVKRARDAIKNDPFLQHY